MNIKNLERGLVSLKEVWLYYAKNSNRPHDCLNRPYPLKFFKGYLPQNLLSRLLNTLPHLLTLSNIDDAEDSLSWKTSFKEFTYSALEYFVSFIDPVKHDDTNFWWNSVKLLTLFRNGPSYIFNKGLKFAFGHARSLKLEFVNSVWQNESD